MSKQVRWALNIWPFVMALLLFFGCYWGERLFLPVIKDFQIHSFVRVDNKIVVKGYMRKVRECDYVGVVVTAGESASSSVQIPVLFLDNKIDSQATVPVGSQEWGPWSLTIPYLNPKAMFTVKSLHSCHPIWVTETELIVFPLLQDTVEEHNTPTKPTVIFSPSPSH